MSQPHPSSHSIPHAGGVIRVVQLTDTHLCKAQGGTLLGMDTDHSRQAVIELVKAERPGIDLLLGTGDLSDQGAVEAYRRLQEYFAQLTDASCWLPGNHDDRANMELVADVQWTFPLDFVEVVYGNGTKTERTVVSGKDLPAFMTKQFRIPFNASGMNWVRFAAWDTAGNGALTQPLRIGTPQ